MAKENRIAVIGMSCRLPGGADSPESLWAMLAEGRDGHKEIPRDRWDWKSFYSKNPDTNDATNFSHGYFLDQDISTFDARFFNISGVDAATIDPQQRLALELTYEALEDAGLPIEDLRGSNTSVHMAMFARDYDRMGYRDMSKADLSHIIGAGEAILANRISYVLDLKGSSNTLDTGCSGGLVALHQACQTLRADEAPVAIAGATQLLLSPDQSAAMTPLTNIDGRCYTFDDRGAGYGRGEGVGIFILKRLDRAVADGDQIHALVVESGVGHDGKTSGIFLPNADAQEALARSVYRRAGLDPVDTLFVECHGTGTVAGDTAEVSSIGRVFGREAGRTSELPIGSIKANIGHLEASSGVAGAVKAIMVLKKNQVPPQLNFINPKPSLHLQERGLKVPLKLGPLTPEGHTGPRRVSLNNFGYGGTNAHVIFEAYEHRSLTNGHVSGTANVNGNSLVNGGGHVNGNVYSNGVDHDHGAQKKVVVLSANTELSLSRLITSMQQWLQSDKGKSTSFTNLVYTLNVRRSKLPWRCSVFASNSDEFAKGLGNSKLIQVKSARNVALGFIFTGQGAQWYAMGRELLTSSRHFASSIASCSQMMKTWGCEWDLVEELSRNEKLSRIADSTYAQPTTTAVQIAVVDLLAAYEIRPQAVCGHSSGEIAAAYAAGALSMEAAMRVSYMRGVCSAEAKELNQIPGGMLAVGEGEEDISKRMKKLYNNNGKVTVACVNSPESTTISGDLPAILELQGVLDAASVFNRLLKVDSAYHSHHMNVVVQSYTSSLDGLVHGKPLEQVAFYSSVTGARKQSDFGPSYWISNMVSQVKFSAAARMVAQHFSDLHSSASSVLVEVGPHAALSGPLRQTLGSSFKLTSGASFNYTYASCLIRKENAVATTQAVIGKIFEAGVSVQFDVDDALRGWGSRRQVVGNLPQYPWDHSNTYWRESRLSKENRLRPFSPHDLVGVLEVGSSPYEPRWRYQVSISTLPWLRDHIVDGFIVLPGASYLIMAIEAMKQLFQMRKTPGRIKNISFRDTTFSKPVVMHDNGMTAGDAVELHLTISPSRQYAGSPWQYFRVVSYNAQTDSWIDNCSGLVSWDLVHEETENVIPVQGDEFMAGGDDGLGHLTKAAADKWLQDIQAVCSTSLDKTETYHYLKATGNEYGESFQGLQELRVSKGHGFAKIVVQDIEQQLPGHYMQPHTIHPSTLDSLVQLEAVCFRREGLVSPIMPVSLRDMSIAVDMGSAPGTEIVVATQHFQLMPWIAANTFCAYQKQADGTYRPVVTGNDVQTQSVGKSETADQGQKKMTYRMEWKADVDFMTQDDMNHLAETSDRISDGQSQLDDKMAAIFIRKAVQQLRERAISTPPTSNLSKLMKWMISWDEAESGRLINGDFLEAEATFIEHSARSSIISLALTRLGPHYVDLFTGNSDAKSLMGQDDLLKRLYSEISPLSPYQSQIIEYLQVLAYKRPYMKVLVTGAAIGGATTTLIEIVTRLPVEAYTYTEASTDSLEHARSHLGTSAAQIDFKTLDILRDPLTQGYTAHIFDLIIAPMVSHEGGSMANLRVLLKPGGRLALVEPTVIAAAKTAVYGTLDGWWIPEDSTVQQGRSVMTVPEWDQYLRQNGFDGVELAIPPHQDSPRADGGVIVARSIPVEAEMPDKNWNGFDKITTNVLQGCSADTCQTAIRAEICRSLGNKGIKCSQAPWGTDTTASQDVNGRVTIITDSAEHPLLLHPSRETFEHVKQLLLQGGNIIWASFQSTSSSGSKLALKNMVNGMARVLRRENPGLRLITVDIQDQFQTPVKLQHIVRMLTDIIMSSFWAQEGIRAEEFEYAVRDGKVMIPRVIPDDSLAMHIDSRSPGQNTSEDVPLVECQYLDPDRPLKFDIRVPGLLNSIRFVDNDEMLAPLGADEVEIQSRAHGVDFKDVSVAQGHMAPGTTMTGEVAGVITAVGSNVTSWKVGGRVAALFATSFGNTVRVNGKTVVAIPDSITFSDAASIPLVFFTAWYCLQHVARIEKGQSVLIHAASDGVGQAAIQLAQLAGADVFVTVSSGEKKTMVHEKYGVPDSHILSSRSGKFKKQVLDLSHGKGVDVVLNSLPGEILRDSWDCLAPLGTFCEVGKTDILGRGQLSMSKFDKQATFAAIDAYYMHRMRPEAVIRGISEIFAKMEQGLLKPVHPVKTLDMSQTEQAFRLVAEEKHIGKLVLVANEETRVKATRRKMPAIQLKRNGTYVIGGGLGDLGKKMGQFLAEKGAGHIVALTRRNVDAVAQQPAVLEVQENIRKLDSTLHIVQCDITDEKSARSAAAEMARLGLPPVRGIIQSATVLRDHPLEFMELDDWNTALAPKVQGTINMHDAFCSSETTNFFIMLSSVSSILGSSSQSNYAAANGFLDAFAHAKQEHNPSSITNYSAINVGAVEGSELVARALDQKSDVTGTFGAVSFAEVLATLEYAMEPRTGAHGSVLKQHIMHFNRDAMETVLGPDALDDPMFDHVPSKHRQGRSSDNDSADNSRKTALQAVEQAISHAEAEQIVRQALLEKFTAFIGDDVPDVPIAALGLDSLVSIELKNWVKHTFKAPLQISELSGAQSMLALAQLIISRMPSLQSSANTGNFEQETTQKTAVAATNGSAVTNGVDVPPHGQQCCRLHKELPIQPLPDLDDSLDYWLEANQHLFDPQQLETIHRDIKIIRAPDSPARQILQDLYAKHAHDKTNGWFTDVVSDARYLCSRAPIAPWRSIMGSLRGSRGKRHSQAELAAIIASAALSYKRAMNSGDVEPLDIAGRPECTWAWDWLFYSARIPQLTCDKMMSHAPSGDDLHAQDHIAVLRKGRVFKVMLQDRDGNDLPFHRLQDTFEAIAAQVDGPEILAGFLTTDERDSWAKIRGLLLLSSNNVEYLNVIDSAMFVLCLDAGSPDTPEQIARQAYIGDGSNRWFDKVLQFYVSANGRAGLITEHGTIDGTTPYRLLEWVANAMDNHSAALTTHGNSQPNGQHHSPDIELEEMVLQTNSEIDDHMVTLKKRYQQATSKSSYVREQLDEFGTDFLLKSRVPLKGVIDLTFQLALRLFFGQNMFSWEPTSAALFHAGRSDAMQRASPAVNAFCDAATTAADQVRVQQGAAEIAGPSLSELRNLLVAATKSLNASMQILFTGRSYMRLLEVLSHLWSTAAEGDGTPMPPFLKDAVWLGRSRPAIWAQSNAIEAQMVVEDFVHIMPDTEGFWSFIVPEKNSISVSLTGGSQERTESFVKNLHRAAIIIRDIVQNGVP